MTFDETLQLCYESHDDLRTLRNVAEQAQGWLLSYADELREQYQGLECDEHRQIWIDAGLLEYEKQLRDAAQAKQEALS